MKRYLKKTLATILALAMILILVPVVPAAASSTVYYTHTFTANPTVGNNTLSGRVWNFSLAATGVPETARGVRFRVGEAAGQTVTVGTAAPDEPIARVNIEAAISGGAANDTTLSVSIGGYQIDEVVTPSGQNTMFQFTNTEGRTGEIVITMSRATTGNQDSFLRSITIYTAANMPTVGIFYSHTLAATPTAGYNTLGDLVWHFNMAGTAAVEGGANGRGARFLVGDNNPQELIVKTTTAIPVSRIGIEAAMGGGAANDTTLSITIGGQVIVADEPLTGSNTNYRYDVDHLTGEVVITLRATAPGLQSFLRSITLYTGDLSKRGHRSEYHTHTWRCNHAAFVPDEAYVQAAIRNDFTILGFADHALLPWIYYENGVWGSYRLMEDYISSIRSLQEQFEDDIDIYLGFEADWHPTLYPYYRWLLDNGVVDYLVLTQHLFGFEDTFNTFYNFGANSLAAVRRYAESTIQAMETGLFPYFAHADYFMMYIHEWCDAVEHYARQVIETASRLGIALEINQGELNNPSRPIGGQMRTRYPYPAFWSVVAELQQDYAEGRREHDVIAVIGVDAHDPGSFNENRRTRAMTFAANLGVTVTEGRLYSIYRRTPNPAVWCSDTNTILQPFVIPGREPLSYRPANPAAQTPLFSINPADYTATTMGVGTTSTITTAAVDANLGGGIMFHNTNGLAPNATYMFTQPISAHLNDLIRFDIDTHRVHASIQLLLETPAGQRIAVLNPHIKGVNSLDRGSGEIRPHAHMDGYFIVREMNVGASWSHASATFGNAPVANYANTEGYIQISGLRVIPARGEAACLPCSRAYTAGLLLERVCGHLGGGTGRANAYIHIKELAVETVTGNRNIVPVTSIGIEAPSRSISMMVGQELTLSAAVSPSYATNPEVTWTSDDSSRATVDANGLIAAVSPGIVMILAEADGRTDAVAVHVTPFDPSPRAMQVRIIGTVAAGETLSAGYEFSDPADVAEEGSIFQWQMSDGTGFVDIPGATGNTFVVTEAQHFSRIRVVVTPRNANGILGNPLTSEAFGPVLAPCTCDCDLCIDCECLIDSQDGLCDCHLDMTGLFNIFNFSDTLWMSEPHMVGAETAVYAIRVGGEYRFINVGGQWPRTNLFLPEVISIPHTSWNNLYLYFDVTVETGSSIVLFHGDTGYSINRSITNNVDAASGDLRSGTFRGSISLADVFSNTTQGASLTPFAGDTFNLTNMRIFAVNGNVIFREFRIAGTDDSGLDPNVAIDFANKTLTGFTADGSYTINGTAVTPTDGVLPLADVWFNTTVTIGNAGGTQELFIPAPPTVPTGLTAISTNVVAENNGRITGVTDAMEFSTDGGDTWTPVTGNEITNLSLGDVLVRVSGTATAFASAAATVTIEAGPLVDTWAEAKDAPNSWAIADMIRTRQHGIVGDALPAGVLYREGAPRWFIAEVLANYMVVYTGLADIDAVVAAWLTEGHTPFATDFPDVPANHPRYTQIMALATM
ncbi:MAG: PHP domain-containing protein, partial [Oscillospiraceae bacterium]|nr:PHP domain-containing protein [Oscillospiraceae bacterium]